MTYSFTRSYSLNLTDGDFGWMYNRYLELKPSCCTGIHNEAVLTAVTDWCAYHLSEELYWALDGKDLDAICEALKAWMRGDV